MRIVNLIENTEGSKGCAFAHGLSFYVETQRHRILMDLGPSEQTLENAEHLNIDLRSVDLVVLSHGHYDHSGGIMPFSALNAQAKIFMQNTAGGEYYADDGEQAPDGRYRYIGIDKNICKLPELITVEGDHVIDEETELFTVKNRTHPLPFTNKRLLVLRNGAYERDGFEHEHFLLVRENGKSVLLSGCAHNGILSILDAYREKYGKLPDLVISGFHLMVKREYRENEKEEVRAIANELKKYPVKFYTCHCTGTEAYELMKEVMGEQLSYVHSGDEILF
ncbi:MAG: MBL fold metallo-hydrolase [Lachnospiraceae bacterium]|nr:MBL fold metallo-hydrolase [Lachnospiraceae bacterium]